MTPDFLPLARRAVACTRFRWMEGMAYLVQYLDSDGTWSDPWTERVCDGHAPEETRAHVGKDTPGDVRIIGPDLRDHGTLGCLLALVEDIYEADAWCEPDGNGPAKWAVYLRRGNLVASTGTSGATRAEALVAALEAAPERT